MLDTQASDSGQAEEMLPLLLQNFRGLSQDHGGEIGEGSWPLPLAWRKHLTPPKHSPAFWTCLKIPLVFPKALFFWCGTYFGCEQTTEVESLMIFTWGEAFSADRRLLPFFPFLNLVVTVKEDSEKSGLKPNIQKTKIMASGPITSWQIDGEKNGNSHRLFPGLQNHCGQ